MAYYLRQILKQIGSCKNLDLWKLWCNWHSATSVLVCKKWTNFTFAACNTQVVHNFLSGHNFVATAPVWCVYNYNKVSGLVHEVKLVNRYMRLHLQISIPVKIQHKNKSYMLEKEQKCTLNLQLPPRDVHKQKNKR